MDKYKIGEVIGGGAFGLVKRATCRSTYRDVAIKQIDVNKKMITKAMIREMYFLISLEHRNLVRVESVLYTEEQIWLVMEYLPMSLKKHIVECPNDYPMAIKPFLKQLLEGLEYCHAHEVVHRDLKPDNILIDTTSNTVKIIDFGLSRAISSAGAITPKVGTLWYRAPEVLLEDSYSTAVDLWAVGCIFAEMVLTEVLFQGDDELDVQLKIFSNLGTPDEATWPGVTKLDGFVVGLHEPGMDLATVVPGLEPNGIDLLSKLLCFDPNKRITAADALGHVYLKDA